jgi:hypothetical protein
MNGSNVARVRTLAFCLPLLLIAAERAWAVSVGVVDDFQNGTTQNWGGGSVTTNVANAGPAGAGDNALSAVSSGRVVVLNESQWTGNYLATGAVAILMDVRNANTFPLSLRLGIASGVIGSGGTGDTYVSANPIVVTNDNRWHHVSFPIFPVGSFVASTTNTNPAPNFTMALSNVSQLRILHNPTASFLGANGPATFFLDNIFATQLPEPGTMALAASAFLPWLARRRARP